MPIPAILAGLGAALPHIATGLGIGAGAYGLGVGIKDRVQGKKQQKLLQKQQKQVAKQAGNNAGPGGIKKFLFGTPGTKGGVQQFANRTPEQMAVQSQILQKAWGAINGNQFDFSPIEEKAKQDFQRETIPTIMERYKGGALNRALSAAGKDLKLGLAGLKQQHVLGQQALNQNLLQLGLAPQFENAFISGDQATNGLADNLGDLFKNPETYGALIGKLQELYKSYKEKNQDGAENGGIESNQPIGEFGQNRQLRDFANQGVGYNVNNFLQGNIPGQQLNKNQVGMGLLNPVAQYQKVNPVKLPGGGIAPRNNLRDAMKLLNPQARF
jgi:hypothetical protein